ncbi:MAG: S8 family serine peptidase [Elusimicrobia bacterium]|nr:S8 family serine peptidase [Elusimicrobiota bacterium]
MIKNPARAIAAAVLVALLPLGAGQATPDFRTILATRDTEALRLLRMAGVLKIEDAASWSAAEKKIFLGAFDDNGRLTVTGRRLLKELIQASLDDPNSYPSDQELPSRALGDISRRSKSSILAGADPMTNDALWSQGARAFSLVAPQLPLVSGYDWGGFPAPVMPLGDPTDENLDSGNETQRIIVSPKILLRQSRYDVHRLDPSSTEALTAIEAAGLNADILKAHQARVVHELAVFNLVVLEVPQSRVRALAISLQSEGINARPVSRYQMTAAPSPALPPAPPGPNVPLLMAAGQSANTLALMKPGWNATRAWLSRFGAPIGGRNQETSMPPIEISPDQALIGGSQSKDIAPSLAGSVPLIRPDKFYQSGYHGRRAIAVIVDSGLDAGHPDFQGKHITQRDFTEDQDNKDYVGHGTHVASTALGTGAASSGKYEGVASGAGEVLVAKVFGKDPYAGEDSILAGLDWGVTQAQGRPVVVNLSLGGGGDPNDVLARAVNVLAHQGHAVIVAAGNAGPANGTVGSPGMARDVLTVAATDKEGRVTDYSSRGHEAGYETPNKRRAKYSKPDISAPGGGVNLGLWQRIVRGFDGITGNNASILLEAQERCVYGPGIIAARSNDAPLDSCDVAVDGRPYYTRLSGTSMATPHVTGATLLVYDYLEAHDALSKNSFLEVKAAQMETSRDLKDGNQPYPTPVQGAGMVDLDRLYDLVSSRLELGLPVGSLASEIALWVASDETASRSVRKESVYRVTRFGIVNPKTGNVINSDAELDLLMTRLEERKAKAGVISRIGRAMDDWLHRWLGLDLRGDGTEDPLEKSQKASLVDIDG